MATINRAGGVSRNYGPSVKVLYTGPFFTQDPAKTFRQNGGNYIRAVMDDAFQTAVRAAPERTGRYLRAIEADHGARARSLVGRKWAMTAVLSTRTLKAPWKGRYVPGRGREAHRGGPYFNYAGRVERRHHVFRKAKSTVYRARHIAKERKMTEGLD